MAPHCQWTNTTNFALAPRDLPTDTNINIIFSVLSIVLAALATVQAAYLARAHLRRNPTQQPSQDVEMETSNANAATIIDEGAIDAEPLHSNASLTPIAATLSGTERHLCSASLLLVDVRTK
jgi:hypothetical protein